MQNEIYSIYDSASESYGPLMLYRANGEAIRAFTQAMADPNAVFSKAPGDFTLFRLGKFDYLTGDITLYDVKTSLGNGVDLVVKNA